MKIFGSQNTSSHLYFYLMIQSCYDDLVLSNLKIPKFSPPVIPVRSQTGCTPSLASRTCPQCAFCGAQVPVSLKELVSHPALRLLHDQGTGNGAREGPSWQDKKLCPFQHCPSAPRRQEDTWEWGKQLEIFSLNKLWLSLLLFVEVYYGDISQKLV